MLRSESPPLAGPDPTCSAEVLGIHGADVTRAIPIFLAYLATLFHTFSLPVRLSSDPTGMGAALGAATGPAVDTEEAPAGDVEAGTAGQQGAPYRGRSSERFLGEQLGSSVSGGLQALGLRLLQGCYAGEGGCGLLGFQQGNAAGWLAYYPCWNGMPSVRYLSSMPACGSCPNAAYEFLLRTCTVSERAPHFVLVTVPAPATAPAAEAAADGSQPPAAWGEQLRLQLQNVLDGLRRSDIAAARERQDQQASAGLVWGWGLEVLAAQVGGTQAGMLRMASAITPTGLTCLVVAEGQH